MYDTTIMLKPRSVWPAGMTYQRLIQVKDAKLQFLGLTNTWTMPVENRLDMELTGIKTPVGMKVQRPSFEGFSGSVPRAARSSPSSLVSIHVRRAGRGGLIRPKRGPACRRLFAGVAQGVEDQRESGEDWRRLG